MGRFAHLNSEISDLKSLAESISRQIRACAGQLQDSPIKGQRHLTQDVRDQQTGQARREEFEKFLAETIRQGRQGAQFPTAGAAPVAAGKPSASGATPAE